jgi:hypothetical protein
MSNLNHTPIIVCLTKKTVRKKDVYEVLVFENTRIDDILDMKKRKPLIPHDVELIEVGVGIGFKEKYEKKYLNKK